VTVVVRPRRQAGVLTNSADVVSNQRDRNPNNNTAIMGNSAGTGAADLNGVWEKRASLTRIGRGNSDCKVKGRFKIQNVGSGRARASVVRFFVSNDNVFDANDTFLTQAFIEPLHSGESEKVSLCASLPSGVVSLSGKFVIAVVDETDIVAENNEANNVAVSGPVGGGS
jgi:subtilase family serine protease